MRIILALLCLSALCAAESAAVATWKKAMAGDDGTAKRDATRALADAAAGSDAEILPLLVQAVGDRQASRWAIESLQKRTGLTKPSRGGPGFPAYPQSDDAAGWSAWLTAWQKDQETKAKIEKLTSPAAANGETPAASAPGEDASGEAAPAVAPPPRIPTEDLGKLDRIVYKSGRSLTAYVRSKRLDGEGNLISVRVVHRDGAGEEVIDAGVIARIEDDVE